MIPHERYPFGLVCVHKQSVEIPTREFSSPSTPELGIVPELMSRLLAPLYSFAPLFSDTKMRHRRNADRHEDPSFVHLIRRAAWASTYCNRDEPGRGAGGGPAAIPYCFCSCNWLLLEPTRGLSSIYSL
jgi:hypothetical protein